LVERNEEARDGGRKEGREEGRDGGREGGRKGGRAACIVRSGKEEKKAAALDRDGCMDI